MVDAFQNVFLLRRKVRGMAKHTESHIFWSDLTEGHNAVEWRLVILYCNTMLILICCVNVNSVHGNGSLDWLIFPCSWSRYSDFHGPFKRIVPSVSNLHNNTIFIIRITLVIIYLFSGSSRAWGRRERRRRDGEKHRGAAETDRRRADSEPTQMLASTGKYVVHFSFL